MEGIQKTLKNIKLCAIICICALPVGLLFLILGIVLLFPLLIVGIIIALAGLPCGLYAAIKILTTDFKNQEINDSRTLWGILSFVGLGAIAELIFVSKANAALGKSGITSNNVVNDQNNQNNSTNQNVTAVVGTTEPTAGVMQEAKQQENITENVMNQNTQNNTQTNNQPKKDTSPSAGFTPNPDEKFHPIVALWNFLCRITLKKASTWIVFGLFTVLTLLSMLLPLLLFQGVSGSPLEVIFDKHRIVQQFLFMPAVIVCLGAGIQGILKTLNIFIDSQKDGTEILIVSKPITRAQIIIARFSYLFIFALCISLVNMLMVVIGMAIVGMDYYASVGTVIGGSFGGSFLSFTIMGIIGALIGLFSDGKVARVLPIVILSISASGAIAAGQMIPLLSKSPITTLNREFSKSLINEINASKDPIQMISYTYDEDTYTTTYYAKTIDLVTHSDYDYEYEYNPYRYNPLNKSIYLNTSDYLRYRKDNSDSYYHLSVKFSSIPQFFLKKVNKPNINDYVSRLNNGESGEIQNDYEKALEMWLSWELSQYANKFLAENYKVGASGAYAVNYLNPMSAFMTIMGISSSSINLNDSTDIAPNYSITDLDTSPQIMYIEQEIQNEQYVQVPYLSWQITTSQCDPAWGVGIMWGSIFLIVSAGTVVGYLRKDFK